MNSDDKRLFFLVKQILVNPSHSLKENQIENIKQREFENQYQLDNSLRVADFLVQFERHWIQLSVVVENYFFQSERKKMIDPYEIQ